MSIWITVVETAAYLSSARAALSDAEREAIVDMVARNPEAGDLIPGTGGLRKIRVPVAGRGKRGGARIVTYFHDTSMPVFLLAFYTKAAQVDLDHIQKRRALEATEAIRREFGRRK